MRRTDAQSAAVPIKISYFNGRVVLLPFLPDLWLIAHRGLLPVADDGGAEELRVLQELLLPGGGGDVGHVELLISPALAVHQVLKGNAAADGLVLPGGEALALQVDVLVLDAPLLEPALRLFGVEGLAGAENLNVHLQFSLPCIKIATEKRGELNEGNHRQAQGVGGRL